jgi:predicted outer membrane repeat protein
MSASAGRSEDAVIDLLVPRKTLATLVASALLAVTLSAPPARAAAAVFYISNQVAAGAGVGAGTGCAEPDVRYTGAAGGFFNDVLAAIYEDPDFDSGETIVVCDIDTPYVMDDNVSFDDGNFDDDPAAPTASSLDLSDEATPGAITIRGSASDAGEVVIDAAGFAPFVFTDATVTVEHLSINGAERTADGAGIHVQLDQSVDGVSLALTEVIITNGDTDGAGGAVYVAGSLTVTDSEFDSNSSLDGGGALYARSAVSIHNSMFTGNHSGGAGGAIVVQGATVVSITNSRFGSASDEDDGNSADGTGGDIWIDSDIEEVAQVSISDTNFYFGQGNQGGSIYLLCAAAEIEGVTIAGASSESDGGAVYISDDGGCAAAEDYEVSIRNSSFVDNTSAEGQGGAVASIQSEQEEFTSLVVSGSRFIRNRAVESWGGAINVDHRALTVTNSTFTQNSAVGGGAIETCNGDREPNEHIRISNSRFISNESIEDGGVRGSGGAIVFNCMDEHPDLIVRGNLFQANRADYIGGAIWFDGWDFNGRIAVTGNRFLGNSGESGGAYGFAVPQGTRDTVALRQFSGNTFRSNSTSGAVSGGRIAALLYARLEEASRRMVAEAAVKRGNRLQGPLHRGPVYQGELPDPG